MKLYEIKRNGALWEVRAITSGIVQFKSTSRKTCNDWVTDNS